MQKTSDKIYPALKLQRKLPVNLNLNDRPLFEKAIDVELEPVNYFNYKNVNVTPEGIVFKNLQLDKDLLIYPHHTKTYNWLYLLSSLVKRKKIQLSANETYLLIYDYWSNSIFHWMCDALPRLQALKNEASSCILLLPENFTYEYITDSLKAFNVKQVYRVPVNAYVNCPNLISPAQITVSGEINPENFRALRKTILDYYQPLFNGKFTSRNIYISRSRAKYRKVVNEEKLLPILEKYNFEIIYFEDMSFAEQVECSYNALNTISIHGANLTNTLFMQAGGNVLEFRKLNDPDNNYFYSIADSVACNYYYMNCETIDHVPGQNFFDLIVDSEILEKNIRLMLKLL